MSENDQETVTLLLDNLRRDPEAFERLSELVYADIRKLAHHQRFEFSTGETLRTTALVHEAFLKVFDGKDRRIHDRTHLMRLMAQAMRQLIVDYARKRLTAKRGGGAVHVSAEDRDLEHRDPDAARIIDMERALSHLADVDPDLVDLVAARFYAGYSIAELADLSGTSVRTVQRNLQRAAGWLKLNLG